ncbi:MAG: TonB-dependent receptor, partial [Pedobacter sp.]
MKNIILLIAYLLVCGTCFAQKTAKVTGKIVDEKATAVPYALVKLLNYPDTSFVKSIQTDFDGFYNFDQVKTGEYILAVDMVGFKSIRSVKFSVAEADVQIPNIKIESLTKNLKEVSITGIKPYVERKVDRTVLNVESSINASGNSALELLEKAPGVTVDRQNDQIRLNNKSGITVMIDGKTNFLSGTDVTTLLSNMSSDQIATIELITNPSSKYDAAGAAGIINIKLKRNKAFGTNGNLSLNTGQAIQPNFPKDMYRVGLSLTLNNRVDKWNIYGTAAFNRKVGFNNINVLRNTLTNSLASSFNQNFANFNIKHDFSKEGTNLTFDADYSGFSNEKNDNFDAQYLNNAGNLTKTTALRNFTDAKIDVLAAKTDFTWAVNKTVKIEAGLKSSYVVTHNELLAEQFSAGTWQNIAGQSNNFIYKENINAAYTNYAKEWKKWQLQLGLRAEYTHSNGNSVTSNKVVDRNYLSLFPTVFVQQTLNKNNSINYSFSRRVDRPNYQQLNPFVFYMDPYALDEGNPYLKPQFTYNFEIGYNYKESSLSFSYADTKDMITQISQQNEVTRIINVIRKNLGRAQTFSANLYVPVKVAKFWRMQNNVSAFLSKFNDGNLEGAKYQASKVAFNFNTNNSITLPQNFSVELGFWLNSPRLNGVEETTITQYALNAGIQKSLMNKKLKIRLSMDDIFLTNHWEGRLQYQNVNLNVVNRYMSR